MKGSIAAFIDEWNPADESNWIGLASRLNGHVWHWDESGPGRSFELKDGVIKPFSNSVQAASPEADGTQPVAAPRFVCFVKHGLDMAKESDKHVLRCVLANEGYGTHHDVWNAANKAERLDAAREGIIAPLALRPQAPGLPEDTFPSSFVTLADNAVSIREAFDSGARLVALRAGTGEGKTEAAIASAARDGSLSMRRNTTALAEEGYHRFDKAEHVRFDLEIVHKKMGDAADKEVYERTRNVAVYANYKARSEGGTAAYVAVYRYADKVLLSRNQKMLLRKSNVLIVVTNRKAGFCLEMLTFPRSAAG